MPRPKTREPIRPGQRVYYWEVIADLGKTAYRRRFSCRCLLCGREFVVREDNLQYARSTRCKPCAARQTRTKHGGTANFTKERLYAIWGALKYRCAHHPRYLAKGVRVCPEWASSFESYKGWALANGYRPGLTIDRRDNDGGYCPANCRWADRNAQMRNTCVNVRVKAFGVVKVLVEWSEDPRCRVKYATLRRRLNSGWPPEQAITEPPRRHGRPA